MTQNFSTARKLALHMHEHGDAFYQSMDEFFRTAVLARALNDYGIPVLQRRCSWQTKVDELGDGIIHALDVDAYILGTAGQLGWRSSAQAQLPPGALVNGFGRPNPSEALEDAITSYAKANSDLLHNLITSAAEATAWLQSQSLEASTPQVAHRSSGPRL
jgi:hypothetical protein